MKLSESRETKLSYPSNILSTHGPWRGNISTGSIDKPNPTFSEFLFSGAKNVLLGSLE